MNARASLQDCRNPHCLRLRQCLSNKARRASASPYADLSSWKIFSLGSFCSVYHPVGSLMNSGLLRDLLASPERNAARASRLLVLRPKVGEAVTLRVCWVLMLMEHQPRLDGLAGNGGRLLQALVHGFGLLVQDGRLQASVGGVEDVHIDAVNFHGGGALDGLGVVLGRLPCQHPSAPKDLLRRDFLRKLSGHQVNDLVV